MKKIVVTQEMMQKQDGKRAGGYSKFWIYLTNLRAYREGVMLGVYLHFPFDEKDLEEAYKMIYVGNEFIDENGESYEEYFIADHDAPFSIDEYDFPQKLAEKYDNLRSYMSYPEEVVRYIADFEGKEASIIHLGGSENLSKYERVGHSVVALGYYEVPRNLLSYIDYEKLGKDFLMKSSGDIVGDYFIEID
ncbi:MULTISPECIES: antirestriction protein ArdA [Enterococcus]|uniref:antirestriction protein ArdA n=1 Tax=Enterococcus TaxID=1350 RepID=UPI0007C17C46|nr:antirestriction protein ArdA [Enterococcus hirae]AND72606.1 antirestriction protein ArdA [Enterococcus hirae]